jgi:tetratricopeptide (TPR) repeat protein
MRVIQGPSAYVLVGDRADLRAIADSLGVTQVLASTVMIEGDKLRVSVKLINGSDGAIRWSHTYSGTWLDRFLLQDQLEMEVPAAIAQYVPGSISVAARSKGPRTHKAYELYLRGRHQWNTPAPQPLRTMRLAIDFFNRALTEDSLYADAYAGLAAAYAVLGTGNLSDFNPRVAADSARIAATKALALNESLPEAHVALAMVDMLYEYDWPGAAKALARAREINPYYSRAPLWPSVYFEWKGDFAEAVREAEKTVSTDPLSPNAVVEYARALFFAGRYEEAKVQVEKARARDATAERLNLTSGEIHLKQRNFSLAVREFERFSRLTHRSSRALAFLANCRATMGERSAAVALLDELRARQIAGNATSFDLSIVHAGLASDDSAFVWLNRAYEDKSIRPLIMDPTFSRLQSDPRFDLLMRRMKLRG